MAMDSLIVPCALIIVDKMLDKRTETAIKTISSSDTSIYRRNRDMAQDIVEQITDNIELDKRFAIQIDELVDVSDCAELLVYIWYFDVKKGVTIDEILGCKQLPERTKGEDIVIYEPFLGNGLINIAKKSE
jgi:hypothetical protein